MFVCVRARAYVHVCAYVCVHMRVYMCTSMASIVPHDFDYHPVAYGRR